jgi:limonene-1,2-epoxide hydrolase
MPVRRSALVSIFSEVVCLTGLSRIIRSCLSLPFNLPGLFGHDGSRGLGRLLHQRRRLAQHPAGTVTGRDDIAATIASFTAGIESIEFRVRNIASDGPAVLTERVDIFKFPDKSIEPPVVGTFEVRDGKTAAWRDYFDMNQFTSQRAYELAAGVPRQPGEGAGTCVRP